MFMSAPFRRVRLGKESRKGKRGRTFHAFLYGLDVYKRQDEYPEVAGKINPTLPDEKARRVGQSVAAASLPELN